ncbi:MAG: phage holin family protein [Deltaproteobacteria bacterium]|nr:phage holin family protein [Deltaproteobacteria bacterium]MBW1977398.1 phage holin family protein [Deltaproteobacteria bacterium]MBW2044052.1 phage holin family protein [Deltaproteobacteria bacterium]MBW2300386.1 phage holin family protein [Deltaproteobacteria bacterium]RLB35570.1 MAG: phage holin family protein [Deltaproteobacteria bacterium]
MKGIVIRWLILAASITLTSYFIKGIEVSSFISAFLAAAVLGVFNAFFRPILIVLTLPINILTLGLFTFIINAMLLKMTSSLIPGFEVHGFWSAVFGSLIISLISWALTSFINKHGRVSYIELKKTNHNRWE